MKVLHYIDNLNDKFSASAKFVNMIISSSSKMDEMVVISGKPSRQKIIRTLHTLNPDIITIHTCWSRYAAYVQHLCVSRGYSVILFPHGALMPNQMQTEFFKQKLPRIIIYQLHAVKNCKVLVATSTKELGALKELGWKKRIALVRNPFSADESTSTNSEEVVKTLRALYQKIIDTDSKLCLTPFEESIFSLVIHIGIMNTSGMKVDDIPETEHILSDELRSRLSSISALEWQHMMLAAYDRGISNLFRLGANALELAIPHDEVEVPSRFAEKLGVKIRINNKVQKTLSKHFSLSEDSPERRIASGIYAIYQRTEKRRCVSDKYRIWVEMSEIFRLLRFEDYDEDLLKSILHKLGISGYTCRILTILSETFLLTEGFMPFEPINDRNTEKLRKIIYKQP